jgi:hypothetical protein
MVMYNKVPQSNKFSAELQIYRRAQRYPADFMHKLC